MQTEKKLPCGFHHSHKIKVLLFRKLKVRAFILIKISKKLTASLMQEETLLTIVKSMQTNLHILRIKIKADS